MNYEEFKTAYITTFNKMMAYSPKEVGSHIYAEKLAELADNYPEWAEMVEEN